MSGQPTPGPWRSLGADMFGDHTITGHDDGLAIAAVVTNLRQQEEVSANARLIASSPELLKVARDAAQHYQSLEEGFIADGLEEVARDCAETRRALQKAIAKAEGRQ